MVDIKKPQTIPMLDLKTVDETEYREAIRGFLLKNAHKFPNVIVKDLDGIGRFLSTDLSKAEYIIKELCTPKPLAPDNAVIKVTDPSNVVKTFLELTQYTVPHGHELKMYDDMLQGFGYVRNGRGNYWLTVGDGSSKTLFVAHLDTADRGSPAAVTHVITEDNYVKTDGTTLLGADDRAGLAVLLYLASQNVAGHYLLVIGEEVGCVGSGEEAGHIPIGKYDRAIEFDRAGTSEIITHQMGKRTASRDFARCLAKEFRKASSGTIQLHPSDRGVYTDTKEFTAVIKECTNIAIGYTGQHSVREEQDLSFLVTIAHAAAKVNWEMLPTKQDYSDPYSYTTWYYEQAKSIDDADVDDDDVFWDTPTVEYGRKSMWEMWAEVDMGNWDVEALRKWVIYNPLAAAKLLHEHITHDPTESLDTLTRVEMDGVKV